MRCRNCGWENDLSNSKCVKCDAPLSGPIVDDDMSVNDNDSYNMLKGTVREGGLGIINNRPNSEIGVCSKCNYPYNPEMGACPNCGHDNRNDSSCDKEPIINTHDHDNLIQCPSCEEMVPSKFKFCANCGKPLKMGTVNPWARPQQEEKVVNCTLTPIAYENENFEAIDIQYTGESVALNRDNTDPNNSSITSKVQAIITYENDMWYIEDRSQMQTTFKHISKKTQLEDNDVILLGNRRFIFNKK